MPGPLPVPRAVPPVAAAAGPAASRSAAERGRRAARILRTVLSGPVSWSSWRSAASLISSFVAGAVFFVALALALLVAAAVSWIVGLGTLAATAALRLAAGVARFDRARSKRLLGATIEPAVLPGTEPGLSAADRRRACVRSPAAWRLVAWPLVRFPASAALLFPAAYVFAWMIAGFYGGIPTRIAVATICLFAWPPLVRLGAAAEVRMARVFLGPSRRSQLSAELQRLDDARTLAWESEDFQRRRIERDLHDGLQPRLVSLALELGLAKTHFDRDPASARPLIVRAHEEAKTAIEDLRTLVRGIHPSVLDERGLDAALSALVAGAAVPVRVDIRLSRRPDRIPEAVVYFVVAEAITNVTKHAGAARAVVTITDDSGSLRVVIEDDGHGGAGLEPGGGLAGLAARVAAADGTFTVSSPPGGPTRVEAVVPCAR
jgi:signal transduction histidine kinase